MTRAESTSWMDREGAASAANQQQEPELQSESPVRDDGMIRIRIDYPNGDHHCVSAPTLSECFVLCGLTDITPEIGLVLYAADLLSKAWPRGTAVFK